MFRIRILTEAGFKWARGSESGYESRQTKIVPKKENIRNFTFQEFS
jgi:hypothetical protein